MSKNLTRKGLAFGALVALAATAISGAPASADANGPITLLPTNGTTFNSIIGSPAVVTSTLDSIYSNGEILKGYYVISNPAGATLNIDLSADTDANSAVAGFILYNADGEGTAYTADQTGTNIEAYSATAGNYEIVTTATKIGVAAATDAASTNDASFVNISIDSTGTDNVAVTVQTLIDNAATGGTQIGNFNSSGFDRQSKAEAITLYAPGNVTATTTITTAARGADSVVAKVVYANSINPYFVQANTKVALYKDGVKFSTDDDTGSDADNTNSGTAAYPVGADGITDYLVPTANNATTGAIESTSYDAADSNLASGLYSARAVYTKTSPDVFIGSASAVADLSNGSNADVDGVKSSAIDSADVLYGASTAANEIQLRTGTKTVTINAQAYDSTVALEAANIKVRAVVTGRTLATGSSLTVGSAAGTIAAAGDKITAYAFTNSKGQVSFTVTSTAGAKNDAFDVVISVLDANGVWVDDSNSSADVDVKWVAAALTTFTAKPGTYVSGADVKVDFYAKDQFGSGIDSITAGKLSVYGVALIAGVETPATYNASVATASGKATLTFKNFAAVGASQQLKATLYAGNTAQTSPAALTVNVYNSLATDKITVADSFSSAITYVDYITGDTTDAAVKALETKTGISSAASATISGTVLNVNNAGQPGTPVVITAAGALFKDGTNYAKDSITVYANEFGAFSVSVFSHTVNVKGAKVTIAADGKTASTLLKTFLPTSLAAANLKFDLSVPALLVKNTTYAVVATLTDKWGNPVNANDTDETVGGTDFAVSFIGTGSVEVNSSSTTLYKDFGKDGKVTVFLRSVKDIAGPGSINATLGSAFEYATTVDSTNTAAAAMVSSIATDDTATAWDESLWSNSLTTDVEILEKKPTASISKGSKSSTVVVKNANGTTIKVVRGSKVATKVATSNSYKVTLKGGTGSVKVYVNGVKVASK